MIFKGDMAYFSQSKSLHNTKHEMLVYDYIKKHFEGNVICPNKHLGELSEKSDYSKIASRADVLFVWAESNHSELTKGCFKEVDAYLFNCKDNAILIETNGNNILLRELVTIHKHDYPNNFECGWVESVKID